MTTADGAPDEEAAKADPTNEDPADEASSKDGPKEDPSGDDAAGDAAEKDTADEDGATQDPAPIGWQAVSSAVAAPDDADEGETSDDSADTPPVATEKPPSHRRPRRSWRQRIADALGPDDVEAAADADDAVAELDGEPEPASAPAATTDIEPLVWEDEAARAETDDDDDDHDDHDDDEDELRAGEGEDAVGDYGVDAPAAVRGFAWAAGATFGLTLIFAIANSLWIMSILFLITVALTFESLTLIWSSRVAKLRERVQAIDALELEGDERVLDVSCGRGLLLIEAASRLDGGEAIGIDVWSDDEDESSPDFALENAEIEGVDDRVLVETADARALPFEDGAFDAVVSGMVSRNIPDADGRAQVLAEIDRVLVPGGRLVILDVAETDVYLEVLRGHDWTDITRSRLVFRMVPPIRYVIGTKPGGEPAPAPDEVDLEEPIAAPDAAQIEADAGGDEALVDAGADDTAAADPGTDETVLADAESAPEVETADNA